ncbi:MAG: InlB B-repeat-containing protein [Erysipelotrichaceae bacterium]|nr:InlB B-repeat-containing protein [Erysipelotrichaceae bacterium]
MATRIHWNTGSENPNLDKYTWHNWVGKEIELPIPYKEGYEFCGWYNYNANNPNEVEKINKIEENDPRAFDLYALWKKDGEILDCYERIKPEIFNNIVPQRTEFYYNMSFYAVVDVKTYYDFTHKYKIGEERDLPIPVREGYVFGGWYDAKHHSDIPYLTKVEKIDHHIKKSSLYLYAKWINEDGDVDDCYDDVPAELFIKADLIRNKIDNRRSRGKERDEFVNKYIYDKETREQHTEMEAWLRARLINKLRKKLFLCDFEKDDVDLLMENAKYHTDKIVDIIVWINNHKESDTKEILSEISKILQN